MNSSSSSPSSRAQAQPRIAPDEWDQLRRGFEGSLLGGTSLSALADNVNGGRWPIKGPDETPAAYIRLDLDGAVARLQSLGLPPSSLDKLAEILRGTLDFDDSFGEMVDVAGRAEAAADPVPRNLERLGIPVDFPLALANLKPSTLEFCEREKIFVLREFIDFARSASRQVIIASEFRDLLNAVSHIDEQALARLLPFRPKSVGLHFIEGLAHLVRPLDASKRAALVRDPAAALPAAARARADRLAAYFSGQLLELRAARVAGTPLGRLVAPLDEIEIEPAVAALLGPYLNPPAADAGAGPAQTAKRGFFRGLIDRLLGR